MTLFRGKIGFFRLLWVLARKGFPLRMAWTCDIDVDVLKSLSPSTVFGHPVGIVLGKGAVIGDGCLISQGVTVGTKYPMGSKYFGTEKLFADVLPKLGNHVFVGANAVVLGNIVVGDDAVIGAGAIVLKDVPSGQTVVGVWS